MKFHLLNIFFLLIISLFALKSILLGPTLYSAHDIWHNIARFYYYHQAILDGQFPPYWISTLAFGHGYPLFFFSFPLPWILGSLFLFLNLDLQNSYKLLLFISFFFSGISFYFLTFYLFKQKLPSLLAAIVYLFAPYHFLTIYVVSAIGVSFVFLFLPIFLHGLLLLKNNKDKLGITLSAIGGVGLILSHSISTFYSLPLAFTAIYIFANNKNNFLLFKKYLFAFFLIILISSFYLLPSKFYESYTIASLPGGLEEDYKNYFVNFSQLLYSKWGFGPIVKFAKEGVISFQLGIVQWIGILFSIILILKKPFQKENLLIFSMLISFIICIFFMLEQSRFLWDQIIKIIPPNYPFRLLLPATFISSLLVGFLVFKTPQKFKIVISISLILTAFYTNRNHIKVNMYVDNSLISLIASEVTTTTYHEYLPKTVSARLIKEPTPLTEPSLETVNKFQNTQSLSFQIKNATQSGKISISQIAFPTQVVYLNSQKVNYEVDKLGRISINIPKGNSDVLIKYEASDIIKISQILSILGLIILLSYLLYPKKLSFLT